MAFWPHSATSARLTATGNVFLSPTEWKEIQNHVKDQHESLNKRDEEIRQLKKAIDVLKAQLAKSKEAPTKRKPRATITISDKPAATSMEVEEISAPTASTSAPAVEQPTELVYSGSEELNSEFKVVKSSKKSKKCKQTKEITPSTTLSVNTKKNTQKSSSVLSDGTNNNAPVFNSDTPTAPSTSTKNSEHGVSRDRASVKIPPIHITRKDNWPQICELLSRAGATVQHAKNLRDSICVKVDSIDAFRNAKKTLSDHNIPYFTYSLPEERPVKVVLRGIPEGISIEEVLSALRDTGLPAVSAVRLTSRRTKQPLPLVLVTLDRPGGFEIWKITRLLNLVVSVESQRRGNRIGQCFRCQKFAHSARCCNVEPHCVKCGQQHLSKDCEKPRTESAVCANCGGNHPANYRGCASFPKPKHPSRKHPPSKAQPRPLPTSTIQSGKSYASAAGASDQTSTHGPTAPSQMSFDEIVALLGNPTTPRLMTGLINVAEKLNSAGSDMEKLAILQEEFNPVSS